MRPRFSGGVGDGSLEASPNPIYLSPTSRICVVAAEQDMDLMKFNSAADIDRLSGDEGCLIGT